MKTQAFIISGYGVPKNIREDFNYQFYLRTVFNKIYDKLAADPKAKGIIVVTGGPTDMRKPYKRTEAGEMKKVLVELFARPALKDFRKRIRIVEETKALSAVENVLYSKRKLSHKTKSVTIFCEWTRRKKFSVFGKAVFKHAVTVEAVDFDQSTNRYLDPKTLAKKEALDIKVSLKALKSPSEFSKLRKLSERRIIELRNAGPENHVQAVRKWWEKEMKEFAK